MCDLGFNVCFSKKKKKAKKKKCPSPIVENIQHQCQRFFGANHNKLNASCVIGPKTENGLEKFEKEKEMPTENVILAALS